MTRMFCTEVQTNPNEYQYHNCFRVFVLERGDLNREKLLANLKFQTGGFTGGGGGRLIHEEWFSSRPLKHYALSSHINRSLVYS